MIQSGSRGHKVKAWQHFLARGLGKGGSPSGFFGSKVERLTKKFQDDAGLVSDGIVGPITLAAAKAAGFAGFDTDGPDPATPSPEVLAADAGVPVAVLQAVREVESNGNADAIRFEPHLFVRLRPDLADAVPYTRGKVVWSMVAEETNKAAFAYAYKLAPEAAVKSTSWGEFQVMGSHLLKLYPDPAEALAEFTQHPSAVSARLVARWFQHSPRARRAANSNPPNFAALALAYNGSHYARHKYHIRLAKAWRRHVSR